MAHDHKMNRILYPEIFHQGVDGVPRNTEDLTNTLFCQKFDNAVAHRPGQCDLLAYSVEETPTLAGKGISSSIMKVFHCPIEI